MDSLKTRNVAIIAPMLAFAFIVGMALAIYGNTLATQSAERVSIDNNRALVQCISSGHTMTECRNLIFGTP